MAWTSVKDFEAHTYWNASDADTYISANTEFLKKNIAWETPVELTISSGAVTRSQSYHTIDTESDGATDDLDTISGTSEGEIICVRAEHTDRTVVLKNGTGNLVLGGDIYLDDTDKHIILISDGTNLHLLYTEREVTFMADAFQYPAPGTDWTPAITGAILANNKSAKKCWLPLNYLKIGDEIVSYKIVGDMHEEGGDTCTFDCKIVSVNKADPLTTTDITGGGISQVTADGNFDSEATLSSLETVATDKQYLLELEGTTSNVSENEFIKVMGAEVKVRRLT
jgi:hypothetical protein